MSDPTGKSLEAAGACCVTMAVRRSWFQSYTWAKHPPINYCPWCGKGITKPAPRHARTLTVLSSSTTGKTAAAAALKAKDWPTGHPHCTTCHGKGYTLKKVGCCNLEPVKCPCTQGIPSQP